MDNDHFGLAERKKFLKHGRLGDLLYDRNAFESVRRWELADISQVYDNLSEKWLDYMPGEIIRTYSLAPPPGNLKIELDYFIRSWPLVNHRYIWADASFGRFGMPRDIACMLFSNENNRNVGRYTIRPELPTLNHVARMVKHNFIEQDVRDMPRLF